MPTYEYECAACGHELEIFQSITAPVKRKCPKCGALKLKRRIGTGAGILFKGSGFYETDYRSAGYKKAADAEKKAATGGDGGGDGAKKKDGATADTPAKKKPAAKKRDD